MDIVVQKDDDFDFDIVFVCLFELKLYVRGKQL